MEIIHLIREQLYAKDEQGVQKLFNYCTEMDTRRSASLTRKEFDLCLNHFGVFLKQQEMSKLIKEYQGASKDEIDYVLFLKSLRVRLSDRRQKLIQKVYARIGAQSVVTVELCLECARMERHAKVLEGKRNATEIATEMKSRLQQYASGDGAVSLDAFLAYYEEKSIAEPYDAVFVSNVENLWGVTEDENKGLGPKLEAYMDILKKKMIEKTHAADGPDHNVRRALKQFDEDEKNAVTAMQFVKGMERFGLHITESEAKDVFHHVQGNDSKYLSIESFIDFVCKT